MRDFRKLEIWHLSRSLVKKIYEITAEFPDTEKYGLCSQLQRAVVSIASNIAEGSSRNSEKGFARFLEIAQGSAFEVETQLVLANDISYLTDESLETLLEELHVLQKKINSLITVIRKAVSH